MKFQDRVVAARGKMTQEQLVAAIKKLPGGKKFTQQSLSKIEKGEQKTTSYVAHIAKASGANTEWLAMGLGEMNSGLTSGEKDLLEAYRAADKRGKSTITQVALAQAEDASHDDEGDLAVKIKPSSTVQELSEWKMVERYVKVWLVSVDRKPTERAEAAVVKWTRFHLHDNNLSITQENVTTFLNETFQL